MSARRISVEEAHRKVESGRALLVCAYENAQDCRKILIAGALTMEELRSRQASLARDQEIIFYCA